EGLFRRAFEQKLEATRRLVASENGIAALQQRRHALESERGHERAQVGHADGVQTSEVYGTKQRDAGPRRQRVHIGVGSHFKRTCARGVPRVLFKWPPPPIL